MALTPHPRLARLFCVAAPLFAALYVVYVASTVADTPLTAVAVGWLVVRTAVEVIASLFGLAFLMSAVAFLVMRENEPPSVLHDTDRPPIGLVYLCCDDADWSALASLASLQYAGQLHLIIHDDSRHPESRAAVDSMAHLLRRLRTWDVRVLRRPDRSGGKAGAVNYVLQQTGTLYEYFLLCDNDSTVLHADTLQRGLAHVHAATVAAVQFRSVPVDDPGYCRANKRLAESIGAFHAFLAPAARYGWMPFIGHNALLRTSAVVQVGGLTPDFFSDDLDLTVRLNLAGFRVLYAPDVEMGEKHPPSYTAFRKRSYKWAYGCVQTLRAHWWSVLRSPRFSLAEKLSFFQFAGFYCLQCLLLGYLVAILFVEPLAGITTVAPDLVPALIVGTVLIGLVYAPLLSFYLKAAANRQRGWVTTLALCGLVYGGTDFAVLRGVTDAFRRKRRAWVPTNGVKASAADPVLFAEAGFGMALLIVPTLYLPELLYLPCWFLFAGKFLFGPALSLLYRDVPHAHEPIAPVRDDGHAAVAGVDARELERAAV